MKQTRDIRIFFQYVIPSVLSFALSGVYAIVDGFFIGNSIGDLGLSAINIAYPIVAVIQALGTGIGMGGAIYYSIYRAEKKEEQAKEFIAGALWVLIISSVFLTISVLILNGTLLELLGANGRLLALGKEYIAVIALGASMQVIGTGLVPFIRNHGGSFYAMVSMIAGFVTNIILDYLFVWVLKQGVSGAAWATVIGQGITMLIVLAFLLRKKQFTLNIPFFKFGKVSASILKIGIAPFGLTMSPNISLIIINRFSVVYGGELAVATYACIAYAICIVYLILQGVGDGSQPLLSQHYGEKNFDKLKSTRTLAYGFALFLSVIGCIIMFLTRESLGVLFGASKEVNMEIAKIMPVFLVSVPFVAVLRIATASFYATEKSMFSYVLTFIEPLFMLVLMLILPPLFGGQIMIWWSTVLARILSALLAVILKNHVDKKEMS
ncbi:MAG: multidrug transporter MatE [Oscillibacter sp.]|jgi:putative MATE family efflux protein|nr:MATE family efflux transporter [uncultured Oscillibacter sp.]MCI9461178.1 multidrug transporter MatE [Oscillibacter sp.]